MSYHYLCILINKTTNRQNARYSQKQKQVNLLFINNFFFNYKGRRQDIHNLYGGFIKLTLKTTINKKRRKPQLALLYCINLRNFLSHFRSA